MKKELTEDQKEFVQKLKDYLNKIPDGESREEPRYVFSGEIIPESLRGGKTDTTHSDNN